MNEELNEAIHARAVESGRNLVRSMEALATTMSGLALGMAEGRTERPEDAGRLPLPDAWWAAHAEAPFRETPASRIPDVDPQGRPGYYLDDPTTSDMGSVQWPVIRVQDPGESECIGYVIRRRDDFSAHSLHGCLGVARDRHNALIMVAHRDDREPVRKISKSLVMGAREVDDEGDTVWPVWRGHTRVGTIREVRKAGANPSRCYTVYVRGRGRSGPFATLDEAEFAVIGGGPA